jgi:SAM-dependent methyltransferase
MEPIADEIDAHDQQRRLPEPVFQYLVSQLADRLRSRQPCLDAGAGSGMITVPLAETGLAMIALDRSPAMLARLTERATRVSGLQIVLGDMTALPFADHTFGSVVVANVFHLIEAWEQAIFRIGARACRRWDPVGQPWRRSTAGRTRTVDRLLPHPARHT